MFKKISIAIAMMATIMCLNNGLQFVDNYILHVRLETAYAQPCIHYIYKTPSGFSGGSIPLEDILG